MKEMVSDWCSNELSTEVSCMGCSRACLRCLANHLAENPSLYFQPSDEASSTWASGIVSCLCILHPLGDHRPCVSCLQFFWALQGPWTLKCSIPSTCCLHLPQVSWAFGSQESEIPHLPNVVIAGALKGGVLFMRNFSRRPIQAISWPYWIKYYFVCFLFSRDKMHSGALFSASPYENPVLKSLRIIWVGKDLNSTSNHLSYENYDQKR